MKALAILFCGLLLVGCAAEVPEKEAPRSASRAVEAREEKFLVAVHDAHPIARDVQTSKLLSAGYSTCDALDSGVSMTEIASAAISTGEEMVAYVAGASVQYLCPEHTGKVLEYLRTH